MTNIPFPIDDTTIIALLEVGDSNGIALAYDKFHGALLGTILKIVPRQELAEEVLQDTFVKAWRSRESYDASKGRLFTWLVNIARNTAIDYTRLKSFGQKNQTLENNVDTIEKTQQTVLNEESIGLKEIVAKIPREQRDLIELLYFQGFTHVEAAERLDIPLGTVKTRARAAILQLRKFFIFIVLGISVFYY